MSITSQINTTGYKCEIIRQTGAEDLLVNLLEIEDINNSLVYDDNMYQSFAELESEMNNLKSQLSAEENSSDYMLLDDISRKLTLLEEQLLTAMEEWETLANQVIS